MSTLMTVANAAGAMPWISTEQLPGVRPATEDERAQIGALLKGSFIVDDFDDNAFLVHDGDLHVPGHFKSTGLLLVRGDLRVDGVYDDDRGGSYGIVAVLGDMQVQNIYSWASLYVRGDLRAQAMVVTVYNDFTFEVGGKLHAAGLLVADKGAKYTAGELGFAFNSDGWRADELPGPLRSLHEAGLRQLRPEFISAPGFRDEVEEGSSPYYQPVDYGALRAAMHAGQPLLRESPAPAELPSWLATAFDFEADDAALLALIGKDPLVDQLMAARVELSATVAEALAERADPIVLEWLAQTHPQIAARSAGEALQPGVARRLAADPATDQATLERIARSADAEVRAALAERTDPPPALVRLLAQDAEPAVRKAILSKGLNVLALEPAELAPLIASADTELANALAAASLSLAEVDALRSTMDRMGHIQLGESLWRQSLGVQPSRMSVEERVQLIDRLLATAEMDDKARALAFVSLDGPQQVARVEVLMQNRVDSDTLMRLSAPEFAVWMLNFAAEAGHAPAELGHNLGLPPALQRRLLELSAKAPEREHEETLEALAGNDYLDREVLMELVKHALERGLRPHSDLSDVLLKRRDLPQPAIELLLARLGYSEDMVLTLLVQAHSNADQVKRAVRRWYDSGDVRREVAALESHSGEAYFRALAQAKSPELREVAAANHATPAALIETLLNDEVDAVCFAAASHPAGSVERIAELSGPVETWRRHWDTPATAEVWHAVAARQTGLGTRLKALEWAAIAELEARRRAQP